MRKTFIHACAGAVLAAAMASGALAQGVAAIPNMAGKVMTVKGPVDPSSLGETLMHEHIFIDFKKAPNMMPPPTDISVIQAHKDGEKVQGLTDLAQSLDAVMAYKRAGGGTIVDVSNFGLTRDPMALKVVSEATGLNVVMGAGWYMHMYHPDDMDRLTVPQLTDIIVRDVTVGAQGTNIRSGIIGEVGLGDFDSMRSNDAKMSEAEIKSITAAARAARITGAPLSVHNFESPPERQRVLDIIKAEGVDPGRVTMSHTGVRGIPTGDTLKNLEAIFKFGGYVEWDYMGQAPLSEKADQQLVEGIYAMIQAGYAKQILLSHDICTQAQLTVNGGGGYTYINDRIIPGLKAKGVSDEVLHMIMHDNPQRALTFGAPAAPLRQG